MTHGEGPYADYLHEEETVTRLSTPPSEVNPQGQPEEGRPGTRKGSRKHTPDFFSEHVAGKRNNAKRTASKSAEVKRRCAALARTRTVPKGVLKAKAKTNSRPSTPVADRPNKETAKDVAPLAEHKPAQVKAKPNPAEMEKEEIHSCQTEWSSAFPSVADTGRVQTTWNTSYLDSLDEGPQDMETDAQNKTATTCTAPEPGAGQGGTQEASGGSKPEQHAKEQQVQGQAKAATRDRTIEEYERDWSKNMRAEAKKWDAMPDTEEIRTRTEQRQIRIQAEAEMVTSHQQPVNPWIGTQLIWQTRGRPTIEEGQNEEKGTEDPSNKAHEYNRFDFTTGEKKEWENLRTPENADLGHLQELDAKQKGGTRVKRPSSSESTWCSHHEPKHARDSCLAFAGGPRKAP